MTKTPYDYIRAQFPRELPWAIGELLIGNVVVGNLSPHGAVRVGQAIAKACPEQPDLFKP